MAALPGGHAACNKATSKGHGLQRGGHELFNLGRGDIFAVVRHFVQFQGFLAGRKPAPVLDRVFAIWTVRSFV